MGGLSKHLPTKRSLSKDIYGLLAQIDVPTSASPAQVLVVSCISCGDSPFLTYPAFDCIFTWPLPLWHGKKMCQGLANFQVTQPSQRCL